MTAVTTLSRHSSLAGHAHDQDRLGSIARRAKGDQNPMIGAPQPGHRKAGKHARLGDPAVAIRAGMSLFVV